MNSKLTKFAQAATLGLAITLTLNACEEKEKKQTASESQPSEAIAATPTQETTQEAVVAEPKAAEVVKGSFTDTRDNKTYKTVKIGEQVWMAENLNYAAEGSCYDNKPANCQKYGRLYNWETAKSACPSGWHLPSDKEWQTLVDFAGGVKVAGKKLKAKSGWDNNGNGTDDFGFSALPGGSYLCRDGCDFYNGGIGSDWWNSSISDNDYMYIGEPDGFDKENGASYSVRCIKD